MSEGILGGNIRAMGIVQVTFDPVSIATITTAEQTMTVPGVKLGDFVWVSKPTATAGFGIVNARVSAADTISITAVNPTAGSVNPNSETWTVMWARASGSIPGAVGG
jgi:hypothetical protein